MFKKHYLFSALEKQEKTSWKSDILSFFLLLIFIAVSGISVFADSGQSFVVLRSSSHVVGEPLWTC